MTDQTLKKIKTIVKLIGFKEENIKVQVDEEHKKILLLIDDETVRGDVTPLVLSAFNHIFNQLLKKEGEPYYVVDLNYYRKERERLITELARAAAHKATITKSEVELPSMNAYERRLVHVEISTHPELTTESKGSGKERRVVIKHLE